MAKLNGGSNCLSPQVLVLDKDWEFTNMFLSEVRKVMQENPHVPYYPGWSTRFEKFVSAYGNDAEVFHTPTVGVDGPLRDEFKDGCKSCLIHVKLEGSNKKGNKYAFENEAFGPILAFVQLDSSTNCDDNTVSKTDLTERFLSIIPTFCNDELSGTLSCTIIAPPSVPLPQLNKAISVLQYGNICVNLTTALGYSMPRSTWGAYPGLYGGVGKAGSGYGVVGNTMGLDETRILKTVVRAPFLNTLQIKKDVPPIVLSKVLLEVIRGNSNLTRITNVLKIVTKIFLGSLLQTVSNLFSKIK